MEATTQKEELKHRIEAKRKELEARIERIKADSSEQARESETKLQDQLTRIHSALKDGWENLTEEAASKLNDLLKDD